MVWLYETGAEIMSARSGGYTRTLAGTIRRQIGTLANRRQLTRLPAFSVQQEPLPEQLLLLLAKLDQREAEIMSPENPVKG